MFFFLKTYLGGPKEKIWKKRFFQEWRWRNFSLTFLESTLKMDLETINLSSVWFSCSCNIGWVTSVWSLWSEFCQESQRAVEFYEEFRKNALIDLPFEILQEFLSHMDTSVRILVRSTKISMWLPMRIPIEIPIRISIKNSIRILNRMIRLKFHGCIYLA